ncbi:hypothetical protein AC792_13110 [Arthrobacter sp. RIT-PI-e]|uniref:hypothetical protein n=1 Tax=Arthrobacter sp. RIT-PI-e TaxID=1681197 RepID=UPI0006761D07|nr:hypothetical protein [Arthrobacter sp. RIT-PI-e]KNC17785.1 hypothetical protein AC792_13110 [Arthrobacter sp. RIT-PI-e]
MSDAARIRTGGRPGFRGLGRTSLRRSTPAEREITIEKAKLRVVLDRRLGRETPASVLKLAEQDS